MWLRHTHKSKDYLSLFSTLPTITSPATALSTYTFVDSLSKGIRYNGSTGENDVKIEFFKDAACTDLVAIWTQADGKFHVEYTDYSAETGSQMTISMTEDGLKEINNAETVYDSSTSLLRGYSNCTLRISYSCTVNSDAAVVYGDNGNPNEVTLTWKRTNTDYYDTLKDCCHVYTYGIDLTKQFSDSAGNFENVKFLVKNSTDNYFVQATLANGVYFVTGHTDQEAEATLFTPTADGKVIVKGLEDDSYIITETATDDGYVLLKENITVDISSAESAASCELCGKALLTATAKVNGQAVTMSEDNGSTSAIVPLTVTNTRGFDLPKTGGRGNALLYGLGTLLQATTEGVMGYVEIPSIDVMLPIYHGVGSDILAKGVGHLPETSLPVGGESTHAVLAGHSGMSNARLFTDLPELEVGDVFFIHIYNKTMEYTVDQIKTVLPTNTADLTIVPGQDYVTLVTCVPVTVNSHRLLVRGTRTA